MMQTAHVPPESVGALACARHSTLVVRRHFSALLHLNRIEVCLNHIAEKWYEFQLPCHLEVIAFLAATFLMQQLHPMPI